MERITDINISSDRHLLVTLTLGGASTVAIEVPRSFAQEYAIDQGWTEDVGVGLSWKPDMFLKYITTAEAVEIAEVYTGFKIEASKKFFEALESKNSRGKNKVLQELFSGFNDIFSRPNNGIWGR